MLSHELLDGVVRPDLAQIYRFDDVVVDPQSFRVMKAGKPLALEPKALSVLAFLVENRGRLMEKKELIDAVWGETFVTENVLSRAIAQLRKSLGDDAKESRYIETVPTRGYRFIAEVDVEASAGQAVEGRPPAGAATEATATPHRTNTMVIVIASAALLAAAAVGALYWADRAPVIAEKDTIVLADFSNRTGDPVFDDALKTGLNVSLSQSPFLNVLPDSRVAATLKLMTRPGDTRLTPDVAREVCQRAGSKAYIAGSIASLAANTCSG